MKFSDFTDINPKTLLQKGTEYPCVMMEEISPGNKFVSGLITKKYTGGGARFKKNDILFARITPCLENKKIAKYTGENGEYGFGSTEYFIFRGKKNISHDDYLYYLALADIIRKPAEASMFGASGRQRADLSVVQNIELNPPLYEIQQKIASILSSYDDLIENNTRRIKALEEMAQRIYREWFAHFRFPGHEKAKMVESELGMIPEGWKVGILDDVTTFSNGFAFKSKELLKENTGNCYHIFKMGQIVKGGGFDSTKTKSYIEKEKCKNLEKYLLKTGDLLMCMTDMKANVALLGHTALMNEDDKYLLNQRVGLIRANNDINIDCPYLYLLTNSSLFIDDIRSRANSGVQVNLSTTEIKKTRILIPPRTINEKFDILGKSIFRLISLYQFKNENLRQTSDLLLPKLISGKISVEDLDIEIPDDVAETSNNILTDSQLIEENNGKQPDSISIKTDEKKPSKEKVDTSEAVRVPPIEEFDINEMMAAFRQVCRSRGVMDREELLKEVSLLLGYKKLGYKIEEVLCGHLRAAIRRKIIGTSGSDVCIETPTMETYKQEELIDTLCSVMRKDREYERDDVIRKVANHLGFKKLRDTVINPIKSAINGAIRRGILDYEGSRIWRES